MTNGLNNDFKIIANFQQWKCMPQDDKDHAIYDLLQATSRHLGEVKRDMEDIKKCVESHKWQKKDIILVACVGAMLLVYGIQAMPWLAEAHIVSKFFGG